jgi:hypothetical protein
MRLAAAGSTTRFILTTREHILGQAAQLYEQLELAGIREQRVLLRLSGYSRLDRARIFYNHAHVSGQLTRSARRQLLTSEAYAAIIDHRAYNPRQIEWITGLSGHTLTEADNMDYLRFAVEALDDPTRLWRHGFENQLDAPQRGVLFVLAGLPDRAELGDLEAAFSTYCGAAGIPLVGRAFERALQVLDDSFVRIELLSGGTFVRFYDASVEDFLGAYLRASIADARAVLRSAIYFEQAERFARLLRDPEVPRSELADDLLDALERCLESGSCDWWEYRTRASTEPTLMRSSVDPESRALTLGRMTGWGEGFATDERRGRLDVIYKRSLAVVPDHVVHPGLLGG